MTTEDPRIQDLLDELLDTRATPEAVCHSCPELLPEVRQRWGKMRRLRAHLDLLFPALEEPQPSSEESALPQIPGYQVEAVLGQGGMGIVFRARHLRLDRPVAIKMLLAGRYTGPREKARFQREAEAAAKFRHPNVVQIYDIGETDGRPYFTLELMEGGSLAQKLKGAALPARQAAQLLATLAATVQTAHAEFGLVHRDLKPANILLTPDGTPKISDFGVARRASDPAGLTATGVQVGTPSYMAPEQARGSPDALGPAEDIYALGAVLYELLTGQPPFQGQTPTETMLQVISQEPLAPTRLNSSIPRDLETICLKCLQKNARRRYATAAALKEDLDRYLRGEPIAARRISPAERTVKWVRRHPAWTALLVVSLLLLTVLAVASQWLAVQHAQQYDAIQAEIKELQTLQQSARWAEAREALQRAEAHLAGGGPDHLRRQLAQAQQDLNLLSHLDAIRLSHVTRGRLAFYKAQANKQYAEAFAQAGLRAFNDAPEQVAASLSPSAVREQLVAALYDWAVCAANREQRRWLLAAARQVGPVQGPWQKQALDPAVWDSKQTLAALAKTVPVADLPVPLLLALGDRLTALGGGGNAISLFRRVQKEHPTDFWTNLMLGNALVNRDPYVASQHYLAAMAARPRAAVGYCMAGDARRLQRKMPEAVHFYEKAIQIDPDCARAHSNLGLVRQDQDRLEEAIACYQKALEKDPDYGWVHGNLAAAFQEKCLLGEACHHYREAFRIDPGNGKAKDSLSHVLSKLGKNQEVLQGMHKIIASRPSDPDSWSRYAELCLFLGRQDEYARARSALLDRVGPKTQQYSAEAVGRACLLFPGTADEMRKAAALTDHSLAGKGTPDWIHRYFLFAKGLAEYRQGQLASAIARMRGEASKVPGPWPGLVLALALHDLGQTQQARQTLAAAVFSFDWSAAEADRRDVWIAHILRREAETKMLPNLPRFLQGEYQPRDNEERLAFLGICQAQGRWHAAAQLYADALAADPALAQRLTSACFSVAARGDKNAIGRLDELTAQSRFRAVRCAALAGCGMSEEGGKLGEGERQHWRTQARAWLREDLGIWTKLLNDGSSAGRELAKKMLRRWQGDADLAGLRDSAALERLTTEERTECLALWAEVSSLLTRIQK